MPAQGWPAKVEVLDCKVAACSRRAVPSQFFFAARAREFQEHTRLCLLLYQAKSNLRVTQQKTRFAQSGLCAGKWHTWSKYITLATVSE